MHTHGGRTTSFLVRLGDRESVIIDAGTGIADHDERGDHRFHIFFTHYHLDHVQGLQFFKPVYRAGSEVIFYGMEPTDGGEQPITVAEAIGGVFRPPWFPVALGSTASTKRYVTLTGGETTAVGLLEIDSLELTHPQGVLGFRLRGPRAVAVIATDHEAGDVATDAALAEFARGADYLFHDAQYTPAEHRQHYEGWGHSTWSDAVQLAERAAVGTLLLTSHDPARTDAEIEGLVAEARKRFPSTRASFQGLELSL